MKKVDYYYAKGSFIKDLFRLLKRRKQVRKQNTFVWCPCCGDELTSNGSFMSDTNVVIYICTNCQARSEWNFDCPVPFLIKWK